VACTGFRSASPTDGRRAAAGAVLILVAAWCSAGPAAAATTTAGIASTLQPGIGAGDFEFYADAAGIAPAAAGITSVRVLIQIPARALLDQSRNDRVELRLAAQAYEAATGLEALSRAPVSVPLSPDSLRAGAASTDAAIEGWLRAFEGVTPVARAETRSVLDADRARLLDTDFRLYDLVLEVPPGDHVVEIQVENLSRRKRGLLDRLRRRPQASVARFLARIPDLTRTPAVADARFRIGHGVHFDYASRLYGLLNDSLHVHSTVFASGNWNLRARIVDREGEVHWQDSLQTMIDGRRDLGFHASVNSLPAGQYVFHLTGVGDDGVVSTARSFDVAWSLATFTRARHDLDVEAEIVLSETEFDRYEGQPLGEKERFLEQFWQRHDPTPETAFNEVRAEFERRVAQADISYSEMRRGALTDRGRVYVHFGAPDELQSEAMPSHLAGTGAEEALAKVDDVYVASEHPQALDPEADALGTVKSGNAQERAARRQEYSRLIGPAREVVSYELWLYTQGGDPLLPSDRALLTDEGLRVLFVDLNGDGRFRLRKASTRLSIRGLAAEY